MLELPTAGRVTANSFRFLYPFDDQMIIGTCNALVDILLFQTTLLLHGFDRALAET